MHKIDGAGHVNNTFVAEDEQNNQPPTEVTAEWLNMLQEELAASVLAFVGALNKNDNGQLLKALIAAQGNNQSVLVVTGNTTLTAADAGKLIVGGSASPFAVTLPLSSAVRDGAKFECVNMNAGAMTIQRQGSTDIINTSSTRTSEVLGTGDSLVVHAKPSLNMWYASGGTNQFAYAAKFGTVGNNAFKLPNGWIVQTGQTGTIATGTYSDITLPTTFPTAGRALVSLGVSGAPANTDLVGQFNSNSSIRISNNNSPIAVFWIAIGH